MNRKDIEKFSRYISSSYNPFEYRTVSIKFNTHDFLKPSNDSSPSSLEIPPDILESSQPSSELLTV